MWWMGIVIIVQTYTANLAAFQTASRLITGINDIEDLGTQTKIKYGTNEFAAPYEFFMVSKITLYQDMMYFMEHNGGFVNNTMDGVKRVRQGNYAFIWDDVVLDFIAQSEPCNTVKTVGRRFGKIGFGLGLQKRSPYKHELSSHIMQLREIGYIDEIKKKWWVDRSECKAAKASVDTSEEVAAAGGQLGISHMLGVFYIIYGGLVTSVVVMVLEWIVASATSTSNIDSTIMQNQNPNSFKDALKLRLRLLYQDIRDDWLPTIPYCWRRRDKQKQSGREELVEINKEYQEFQYRSRISMASVLSDTTMHIASSSYDHYARKISCQSPGSTHLGLPNMPTVSTINGTN
ncbi:unnamed protein product [Owenia fusiformis]|uniref:Ionotropic glutamate receptor C-terminal domain-containing protein n=1 Tax=Owenia fusiformis TaxID=6347 RepID=A0A8S4PF31_OWEFU|nr:unnamed protein product [Owenia fusiformis]